uniref:HECT domain-containing protein n=1 Tax=Eutreptiella gymnastica TaxID=73025 RepID=A0A7S1IFJ8_9EUGL
MMEDCVASGDEFGECCEDEDHEEAPNPMWRAGDVVGCWLEIDAHARATMSFSLNGRFLGHAYEGVPVDAHGLYPACSMRSGDKILLNFGGLPFKHKPPTFQGLADSLGWMQGIQREYGPCREGPAPPADKGVDDSVWHEDEALADRAVLDHAIVSHYNDQWTKLVGTTLAGPSAADAVLTPVERFRKSHAVDAQTVVDEEAKEGPRLAGWDPRRVQRRFAVLCRFNILIKTLLPMLNMDSILPLLPPSQDIVTEGTNTRLLSWFSKVKGLLFAWNKEDLFQALIVNSSGEGYVKSVVLNRIKPSRHSILADPNGPATPHAAVSNAAGKPPPHSEENTLFHQLYQRFQSSRPHLFRQHESCDSSARLWTVVFEGEAAEDAGGPFRESLAQVCEELMSDAVALFIPSPNQRNNFGNTREMYVPNPSCHSPSHLSQFRFVGRLMAGCITINEPMNLNLPSLVWKTLVGTPTDKTDLIAVDQMCVTCMDDLCTIDRNLVHEEEFHDVITESFKTVLSDGTEVELVPNGREKVVTFEERNEYAKLVIHARLNESREQILAMRQGLLDVLPPYFLALLTWRDLELRVCGIPEIDIAELKQTAIYEDVQETDQVCIYFWDVLAGFTQRELRLLLRFIAGRSRLPVQIKIQTMPTEGNPDHYLPQAHTCFFSIELPLYSCVDAMRNKLLYAIYNCSAIDTDNDNVEDFVED